MLSPHRPAEASRVSIVIPHYNHGRIIRRQIAALMRQRLTPFEIIIVDDGSSQDKIAEVHDAITDCPSARVVVTARNSGAAAACNIGLELAQGDFVAFEAADDEVLSGFLEKSVAALNRYPLAGFSFSDPATVNPTTGQVKVYPLYLGTELSFIDLSAFQALLAGSFFTFTTLACLFRCHAARAAGGMPDSLGGFADNFLDFVLAFRHGAVYVPEVLAHYYTYETSYSRREHRNGPLMRRQTFDMVDLLSDTRFADVQSAFRRAGILPEHRLRTLLWLLLDRQRRSYLNPLLVRRCLVNSLWLTVMPWVPLTVRRLLRRLATKAAQARTRPTVA